jgi:hypothetical protein
LTQYTYSFCKLIYFTYLWFGNIISPSLSYVKHDGYRISNFKYDEEAGSILLPKVD